jgi:hypothetical protein
LLPDFEEYCQFIATLPDRFPSLHSSTLTVYTIGPFVAEVEGQLTFAAGYTLDVWELLDFSNRVIRSYSDTVDQFGERVWWYDSQAHPNDPTLAATDPHHKHVHPDSKHHRIPAPEISFTQPHLLFLIREVEQALATG